MELLLVASGGGDPDSRLLVGEKVAIVGRSRSADLVLKDPGVSRHHLRVQAIAGAVQIDLEAGAAPFVFRAQSVSSAQVAVGQHVIVGSTVLSVIAAEARPVVVHTLTETILDGIDADVRGLSAVSALLQLLAGADDRTKIAEIVDGWARSTLRAELADAPAGDRVVSVGGLGLAFAFSGTIDRSTRTTAEVAGAIVAACVAAAASRHELRTLAVGSARGFLGTSAAAAAADTLIRKLAASDTTVLILGESGTGKTFAARLIHEQSARAAGPLRVLNCAAIPETLLEAELFGSEKGAFSGSHQLRIGAFEAAGTGTLLLDEIGELSLASQAKLLRAIEEKQFERIGSNKPPVLRARILAATNRDLRAMIDAGTFRSDLYFRISVVTMTLPALRDRGEDLELLTDRILADLAPTFARRVIGFTAAARAALARYPWPGNVRELRNAVEHACVLGEAALIDAADLPELVRTGTPAASGDGTTVKLPADLRWLEERAIEAALAHTGGNRTKAAALLGINRVTLQKKLAAK